MTPWDRATATRRCRRLSVIALMTALLFVGSSPAPSDARPTRAERERAREMLAEQRDRAVETILTASESDDAALRANAIEASQSIPEHAAALATAGLEDANPAVRFSALVTIGQLGLTELGQAALEHTDDENDSVRAAAIFAAQAVGEEVDLSPLAGMLASPEPGVRSNVAMLMGLLGDASAVPMLKELAHAPMRRVAAVHQALVRIHIAEALVELGEEAALDALRAGAYSHHDEVRVLAVQALGKLGDRQMEAALMQIVEGNEPIELRLAAAEALARLGGADPAVIEVMREGAAWDEAMIRAQAAFALGRAPHPEAAERLIALLQEDPSEQVQLTAAAAIVRAQG